MAKSPKLLAGCDLGGTNIVSAVVTLSGKILAKDKRPTEAFRGQDTVLKNIRDSIHSAIAQSGVQVKQLMAVGVGSPGPLNTTRGVIYETPNLPFKKGLAIRSLLQKHFPCPVFLENDANAAAWGEKWVGAAKSCDDVICLTLGTGVGGGIILDGKLWRGKDDSAAELGHMILFPGGVRCNCGNQGCLESYASATATARRAREAVQSGQKTVLTRLSQGDPAKITSALVYQGILQGDKLSKKIMEDTGKYLGIVIGTLLNILNPQIVVLSGGMISAGRWLFDPIRETAKKHCWAVAFKRARIVPARLGDDAGVIGAAGVALERLKEKKLA